MDVISTQFGKFPTAARGAGLSRNELATLAILSTFVDGSTGFARIGQATLARHLDAHRNSVNRWLSGLEKAGIIRKMPGRDGGRCYNYIILGMAVRSPREEGASCTTKPAPDALPAVHTQESPCTEDSPLATGAADDRPDSGASNPIDREGEGALFRLLRSVPFASEKAEDFAAGAVARGCVHEMTEMVRRLRRTGAEPYGEDGIEGEIRALLRAVKKEKTSTQNSPSQTSETPGSVRLEQKTLPDHAEKTPGFVRLNAQQVESHGFVRYSPSPSFRFELQRRLPQAVRAAAANTLWIGRNGEIACIPVNSETRDHFRLIATVARQIAAEQGPTRQPC